jgi:hypothetical protein
MKSREQTSEPAAAAVVVFTIPFVFVVSISKNE